MIQKVKNHTHRFGESGHYWHATVETEDGVSSVLLTNSQVRDGLVRAEKKPACRPTKNKRPFLWFLKTNSKELEVTR